MNGPCANIATGAKLLTGSQGSFGWIAAGRTAPQSGFACEPRSYYPDTAGIARTHGGSVSYQYNS
jgi:hypothetical protein